MRVDFKFRHIPHSEELTQYVSERIARLEKFELKPTRIEFTFFSERSCKCVDVQIRGDHLELHAHAEADTFFSSVDQALNKIARQLSKKKDLVQDHQGPATPDLTNGKGPKVG